MLRGETLVLESKGNRIMTTLDAETMVGSLVADRPARARVFEPFGIDYCCGGKRTLGQACERAGIDLDMSRP